MSDLRKIHFKVVGTSPVGFDQFQGQEEAKRIRSLPEDQQCEKALYRTKKGTIGIPGQFIVGALRDEYILEAPPKTKRATEMFVAPRLGCQEILLDTGQKNYTIRRRAVPAGNMSRGGCMDFKVTPLLEEWTVEGTLVTTLPDSLQDLKAKLVSAGINIGIGKDRKHGFGRFTVTEFEIVS